MIVRVFIDRVPFLHQGGLYDGDEWQRAAWEWATAGGMTIEQWRCNQTFRVTSSPAWWRIEWDAEAGKWTVEAI